MAVPCQAGTTSRVLLPSLRTRNLHLPHSGVPRPATPHHTPPHPCPHPLGWAAPCLCFAVLDLGLAGVALGWAWPWLSQSLGENSSQTSGTVIAEPAGCPVPGLLPLSLTLSIVLLAAGGPPAWGLRLSFWAILICNCLIGFPSLAQLWCFLPRRGQSLLAACL